MCSIFLFYMIVMANFSSDIIAFIFQKEIMEHLNNQGAPNQQIEREMLQRPDSPAIFHRERPNLPIARPPIVRVDLNPQISPQFGVRLNVNDAINRQVDQFCVNYLKI